MLSKRSFDFASAPLRMTGTFVIAALLLCPLPTIAQAAAQPSLISDEETEALVGSVARKVFQAADIPFNPNNVGLVADNGLNAFVADGNALFVNTGTILAAPNPDALYGVVAHEAGHIAGGHIARAKIRQKEMRTVSLASLIAAGALGAASGRGDVAAAVLMGGSASLVNSQAAHQVEEERGADQTAVRLLQKMKKSPKGLYQFMEIMNKRNRLGGREETPYLRTHPVTAERLAFLEAAVRNSPYPPADSQAEIEALRRVQAKLAGFLLPPAQALAQYPASDNSQAARYARAIVAFRQGKAAKSLAALDALITDEPRNPYFRELKAQFLFESGKVPEAAKEYREALNLRPDSANFQLNLAMALIESNPKQKEVDEIVSLLNKANLKSPSGLGWLLLSRAYEMKGDRAGAAYAAAEHSLRLGALDIARQQAEEAKRLSKSKSLSLKIDDLLNRLEHK